MAGGDTKTRDTRAATFVVNPTGEGADFTSIQAALDALPAEGGTIYLREGTYSISTAIALPISKPVKIAGAGAKATILDLGVTADALFRLAAGAAFYQRYVFEDLTLKASAAAGQHGIDTLSAGFISFSRCVFENLDSIVSGNSAGPAVIISECEAALVGVQRVFIFAANGSLEIAESTIRVNGSVVSNGYATMSFNNARINCFSGPATLECHTLSSIIGSRLLDCATVLGSSGGCRLAGVSIYDGTFTVSSNNNVLDGVVFDSMALGMSVTGTDNVFTGIRFLSVTTPITESGGAARNRYVNCHGLKGSTFFDSSMVDGLNVRNVMAWGATGDGSTNDRAAIQAAIDALPAGGGTVFFPPGTYKIGTTLNQPDKPVKLLGCGDASVIDLDTATIAALTLAYNKTLHVEDLKIEGNGSTGQIGVSIANAVNAAVPMSFVRVTMENIEKPFVAGASSYAGISYINSKVTFAAQATSILWSGGSGALTLHNVTAMDDGAAYRGGISGNPYVWISECNLGFIATSSVSAMWASSSAFVGSFTITSVRSLIVGCNHSAQSVARRIDLAAGASNTIIKGCKFNDWTSEAIRVAASNCIIEGNENCKVTETGSPDNNIYANNHGFAESTILGSGSRVDGVQMGVAAAVAEGIGKAVLITTPVGNVGAGEDDLQTYSLPAKSLYKTGSAVRIRAWGTTANNANAKTVKLYFGSTAILTYSLTISQAGKWKIEALVAKTGSNAQKYESELLEMWGSTEAHDMEFGTATETDTSAIIIKCTGEGTNDNDIVQEGMLVEVMN